MDTSNEQKRIGSEITDNQNNQKTARISSEEEKGSEERGVISSNTPPEPPKRVSGETLAERLRNAVEIGGLRELPEQYEPNKENTNLDWKTILSDNYFERLYIDYSSCIALNLKITEIVNQNYKILKRFWEVKRKTIEESPVADKIARRYDTSKSEFKKFLTLLEEAYRNLDTEEKIEYYIRELEAKRKKAGKECLLNRFEVALKQWKQIDNADIAQIKNVASGETKLRPEEVEEIIEEWIKKYELKRVEEKIAEAQLPLFKQLKKRIMDDGILSQKEEIELWEDYKDVVGKEDFERLVRRALYESGDAERELTLQEDEEKYRKFYYQVLSENGLENEEIIKQRLSQRQSSREEFIPLRNSSKKKIEQSVRKQYKQDLEKQENSFRDVAKKEINYFSEFEAVKDRLMRKNEYPLLLPYMREAIIEEVVNEKKESQEIELKEALAELFRRRNWNLDLEWQDTNSEIIWVENRVKIRSIEKEMRVDWIKDELSEIFVQAKEQASEEYKKEKEAFKKRLQELYSQYEYGLPALKQKEIEKDRRFNLSSEERRQIIIQKEKKMREAAKEEFTEKVRKEIISETLIPEVSRELIREGVEVFLLTKEKNEISHPVDTAEEIIQKLVRPVETVVEEKIEELSKKYKLSEDEAKMLGLEYRACIPKAEIEEMIASFENKSGRESKTLRKIIENTIKNKKIEVIADIGDGEYVRFLTNRIAPERSNNFASDIEEWLSDSLKRALAKVGSGYGLTEKKAKKIIETYFSDWYKENTQPKWKTFAIILLSVTGLLLLLRVTLFFMGATEWNFVGEEIYKWQPPYKETVSVSYAPAFLSENWWLGLIVFGLIVFLSFVFYKIREELF